MNSFSKQQVREFRKLLTRLPLNNKRGDAENFLLRYIGFEAVCRKVWHYYRCRKVIKSESHAGIPIKELKKAFKHFNIEIDDSILELLLSSELKKRNSKSARNLRNGMVHAWKQADCDEASKRIRELTESFDVVVQKVKLVTERSV